MALTPTAFDSGHRPASEEELTRLESMIREDFERCHPGDTLDDLKRRASFSREDRGLLRDWMAVAARRAAADRTDHSANAMAPENPSRKLGREALP